MVAVVLNGLVHLVLVEVLDGSLVPAEGPEGRQLGSANDSMILLNHLLCRAENEEVYLQLATKGDVAEYRLVRLGIVESDDGKLGIAVPEKDTDVLLGLPGLNKDEWMHTVLASAAATIVNVLKAVDSVGPHTEGALSEFEGTSAFTEAVLALARQQHVHLDVLVSKDEVLPPGVEDHSVVVFVILE